MIRLGIAELRSSGSGSGDFAAIGIASGSASSSGSESDTEPASRFKLPVAVTTGSATVDDSDLSTPDAAASAACLRDWYCLVKCRVNSTAYRYRSATCAPPMRLPPRSVLSLQWLITRSTMRDRHEQKRSHICLVTCRPQRSLCRGRH